MTRATTPLAVAADYADALMTARRAKNLLFLLLLLFILVQLAFFFLARYGVFRLGDPAAVAGATPSASVSAAVSADAVATQPTLAATRPVDAAPGRGVAAEPLVRYVTPLVNVGAVAASVVLAVVMLLLVTIMLVGRLIGVANVTGAFIWGVLLVVVLFPWQAFLIPDGNYPVAGGTGPGTSASAVSLADAAAPSGAVAAAAPEQPAFKFPGALYTYPELKRDHRQAFTRDEVWPRAVWFWGRFVGMPVLAMLLLFVVQAKSSRGLRYALGEADLNVEVSSRQDISVVS